MITKEDKREFLELVCSLSPENISWDGERSPTEIRKAKKAILAQWKRAEKRVGRTVEEWEVWEWSNEPEVND